MTNKVKVIEIPEFNTLEELLEYCENIFSSEDALTGFVAWKHGKLDTNKIPMRSVRNISIEILKKA